MMAKKTARKSSASKKDEGGDDAFSGGQTTEELAEAQQEHTPETRPSDSGARQPDHRAAAARRVNAAPGTEIETSPGPQEVGATRGARRPYTTTLPGARVNRPAVLDVPTEEQEKFAERRERALKKREEANEALEEGEPVKVIALRMGAYPPGPAMKRIPAGSVFAMRVPKGQDIKTYASWVQPYDEYQADLMAASEASAEGASGEPASTRRGARKAGASAAKGSDKDVI